MSYESSTTGPARTFSLKDLEKLEEDIKKMIPRGWTLIAPDGRVWHGSPMELFMTLARAHYQDEGYRIDFLDINKPGGP